MYVADHILSDARDAECHKVGNSHAVEVALETVADGLVQEDARPARAEDDRHRARRRVRGGEVGERLPARLAREALGAAVEQGVERVAPAASVAALLAPTAALRDAGDAQMHERPHAAQHRAR